MEFTGLSGGFYKVSEWIMRIVYVNFLWMFFTLIGFVILGIMPATIAMFTLIRRWYRQEDFPTFQTYWQVYKQEFINGNKFGIIFGIILYLLYFNLQYLSIISGTYHTIMLFGFSLASLIFVVFLLYFFPVYVHFDLSFREYLRQTLMLGLINFHMVVVMVIVISILYFLFMSVPGLAPFFSIGLPAFFIMAMAQLSFKYMEEKHRKNQETPGASTM